MKNGILNVDHIGIIGPGRIEGNAAPDLGKKIDRKFDRFPIAEVK
jgi:hypothetical protein